MLPFAPWHSLEQGNHLTMPMRWGWHLEVSMVQNISESSGHRGRWTMKTAGTLGHHPALAQEHVPQQESACFACRRPWDQSPASPCFLPLQTPPCWLWGWQSPPQTPAKNTGASWGHGRPRSVGDSSCTQCVLHPMPAPRAAPLILPSPKLQ